MLLPWVVLLFVLVVAVWGLVHSLRLKNEMRREHRHFHEVTGRRPPPYA
jgi:hypothetical protein